MKRRDFLTLGCIFPFFINDWDKIIKENAQIPTLADPVPPGYKIAIRGMIGSDEHVVFRNEKLKKYRIYINGRFACEQKMEVPIDFQKLTVDKKKR